MDLPRRAKAVVISAVIRAGLPWAVFAAAAVSFIYVNPTWGRLLIAAPITFVVVWVAVSALVLLFPIKRVGGWAVKRLATNGSNARLANIASGLAIAIGVPEGTVAVIESDVPNVGAFPTRSGDVVVATEGATTKLARDELEALVASQLGVAGDGWVRVASSAQLVQSPRFALLFFACFLNPVFMPFAFLAFFGGRYADGARDLVADAAAVRATRNPEALVRALRQLAASAADGSRQKVGAPGFLIDQFWVLSTRSKATTTVSTPGGSRRWTTATEISAEMRVRADRVERAARGDWDAFTDIRSWRRAVRSFNQETDQGNAAS